MKKKETDYFDIKEFISIIIRNKKLIFSITFFSFVTGCFISFIPKKIWRGETRLMKNVDATRILESNKQTQFCVLDLDDATSLDFIKNESILKNTIKYVEREKKRINGNDHNFKASQLLDKISVEYIRGTKIINVRYEDHHEELILPVLGLIPKDYENFLDKNYKDCIEKQTQNLKKRIEIEKNYLNNAIYNLNNFTEANKNRIKEVNINKIKQAKPHTIGTNLFTLEPEFSYIDENLSPNLQLNYETLLMEFLSRRNDLEISKKQFIDLQVKSVSIKDPLLIINKPVKEENPIYPEKKKIAFLALLIGAIVSLFIVLFKEED